MALISRLEGIARQLETAATPAAARRCSLVGRNAAATKPLPPVAGKPQLLELVAAIRSYLEVAKPPAAAVGVKHNMQTLAGFGNGSGGGAAAAEAAAAPAAARAIGGRPGVLLPPGASLMTLVDVADDLEVRRALRS